MALVGEALLTASIQVLCDRIASRDFIDLFRRKKLDDSLLKKLDITLLGLSAVLNDAEEKQIVNPAVRKWLDEVKHTVLDAEDLLDEINSEAEYDQTHNLTQVLNFLSTSYFNPYCQSMNAKIRESFEKLEHLAKQKDILGLGVVVGGKVSQGTPTTSLVDESSVYGRDGDKKELERLLFSDHASRCDVSVIAIVGMGGVGKTTLARLLYNGDKVKEYFTLKSWACVSEDYDAMRVTKTLIESITRKPCDITNWDFLQGELTEQVRGKKFLFVLDDLWNENSIDWKCLQAPFAFEARGSKVIVTTRNEKVASIMNNVHIQYLEPLSLEDCWLLLAKQAFANENPSAHPHLQEIGKQIARKCNGLPLAAEALGGLLRCNKDYGEWNSILKSNIWQLSYDDKSYILPALGLSYHYLPAHLKQCFVYCSIFPKDYEFKKEDVVLLWIAEGLIPEIDNGTRMEEVAKRYFDQIVSRSLFKKSKESSFTMHDLINDLAVFIAKGFCFRIEGKESNEVPKTSRHLSYVQEQFDTESKFEPLNRVKCLRTFLPLNLDTSWQQFYVSKRVSHDFVLTQRCLRVLSLSNYINITELPNSIGNLIHLRYLDLSSTAIKRLPDIVCSLCNLQTILLSNCFSLNELPGDMSKLINLRHLDLRGTNIKEMPLQMGRLKSLRTLTTFVVGNSIGSNLTELRELRYLRGSLSILKLQNVVDVMDASHANLKEKNDLKELTLEWGKDTDDSKKERDVLEKLRPPINLEKLTIKFYGGTSFPNWVGDSSFSDIKVMHLNGFNYCLSLPPLGQLPAVKKLTIVAMKSVRKIGPEFYGNGFQPFQSLEKLTFQGMLEWEEWQASGGEYPDFPRLQELNLYNCPKLRGNLPNHLPYLQKLSVINCVVLYERATTTLNMDYLQQYSFEELRLVGCPHLLSLLGPRTEYMSSLGNLGIGNFGDIECLPKQLVHSSNCVVRLTLNNCPSLLSFPRDGLPTTLEYLRIENCRRLEFLPHEMMAKLTSLGELWILDSCDSLRSYPLGIFPKLSTLLIRGCMNLESLSIEGVDENLRHLQIRECPNLVSFPHGGLPTPNLRAFIVTGCQNLKSLPERIHTLTALQYLDIQNLPNVSISEGGLPPNLRSFSIFADCDRLRPSAEWGLQGLVSLQSLYIQGTEHLLETLLKEQLLPTTLNTLSISDVSLKSLNGKGLQHLTSLQSLQFHNCPNLESLPGEGLLASISFLGISRCSTLKKRYCKNKTGEDWAKIARIPCIKIDEEVII